MSNIDPNYEPGRTTTIRVERRSNTAAWWVVGVIAVAAIGVTGYVAANQNPSPTAQQLQATADQAHAQGVADGAQQAQAIQSAQSAAQAQQMSADQAAQSRAAAEAAADRSAMSADQAARNSSATVERSDNPPPTATQPSDQNSSAGGQ